MHGGGHIGKVWRRDAALMQILKPSATYACASACENVSRSTLPPDATTATVLPLIAYLPLSTAARATAPPGSTTSLKSAKATAIASAASRSLTAKAPASRRRLIAKVSPPGVGASSSSQNDFASGALNER